MKQNKQVVSLSNTKKSTVLDFIDGAELNYHEKRLETLKSGGFAPDIMLQREQEIIDKLKSGEHVPVGGKDMERLVPYIWHEVVIKKGNGGKAYYEFDNCIAFFPNAEFGPYIKQIAELPTDTSEPEVPQTYLVLTRNAGERTEAALKTGYDIIKEIDMFDCYKPDSYEVYDVSNFSPVRLDIHGTWHEPSNPLYIKLTDGIGQTVIDGYGTEH